MGRGTPIPPVVILALGPFLLVRGLCWAFGVQPGVGEVIGAGEVLDWLAQEARLLADLFEGNGDYLLRERTPDDYLGQIRRGLRPEP